MTYDEFINGKDPVTGQAWSDFAKARGFTHLEMVDGLQWQRRVDAMREDSTATKSAKQPDTVLSL